MRLLQLQNDGNISLTEVFNPIPPYAILSHTWAADDEEVTYRDLVNGEGKEKPGYQKLLFCGKQAASLGLNYYWVDTCSIDKSSSAELTEAINSMFRWYRDSVACFVYMADVFIGNEEPSIALQWQQNFRRSRWFTRGWTLQELLAPKTVQFFSQNGHFLGDKRSMQQVIHEITGVATEALEGGSLDRFSIEERMSWASTRATKREEDAAYSLLGLFGVHMPLIYGEGQRGAFIRLRKEIRELRGTSAETLDMAAQQKSAILQNIEEWLQPADPSSNHQQALKKRQHNTGLWLLEGELYQQWKSSPQSFIWLHGIPGSGKTILSSTLIDDVTNFTRDKSGTVVAYFYFDFNDVHKQRAESLLKSLISQLSQKMNDVSPELDDLFAQSKNGRGDPSLETLLKVLQQLLREFSHAYLVIDALDECSQRDELMGILATIARWNLKNTHMVVASRLERDIEIAVEGLALEAVIVAFRNSDVDKDIRQYVRQRLSDDAALKKWNGDPGLRSEIEDVLTRGSQGMFRWAVCQLDTLGKCRSRARLRASLAALPATLESTYDRILCNIDEEDSLYSFRILRWLTFANQPLIVDEIAEIVALDPERDPVFMEEERLEDPMEALDICASLVTLTTDPSDGRRYVVLAHYSVKEYFLSDRIRTGIAARYGMESMQCQNILAKACLLYLLQVLQPVARLEDVLDQNRLVRYCAEHWMYHVAEAGNGQTDLARLAARLLSPGTVYARWLRICQWAGPLYEVDAATWTTNLTHPLPYVATLGLTDVVKLLLEQEVDIETWPWNRPLANVLDNALQAAARGGHLRVVEQLLAYGAEVNALGAPWGSALQAACSGGHDEIAKALLEAGADANTVEDAHSTALEIATRDGSTAMVETLLEYGANVSTADHDGFAPIHLAALYSNFAKAKLLLEHGAYISAADNDGTTSFMIASAHGYSDLVQLFHDKGADFSVADRAGRTSLFLAVNEGHYDMVKLLLEYDREAAVSPKLSSDTHTISDLKTVFPAQQWSRHSGVSATAEDVYGETVATKAASQGFQNILTLLFESSIYSPDSRDRYGRSLLWWAAANGQAATVSFLLYVHDCDPSIPDHCNRTPLMIAAKKGFHWVVEILEPSESKMLVVSGEIQEYDEWSTIICDVCTMKIRRANTHYHCGTCANGDWDVCLECYGHGMVCTVTTHVLIRRTMSDGIWVELDHAL